MASEELMAENAAESDGPYTCCRCDNSTWNDDDWCDRCVEEARLENERMEKNDD